MKSKKKLLLDMKYTLYESAVQAPMEHMFIFTQIYNQLRKKKPHHLREDFCGTFSIASQWLKLDKTNTAVAIDLATEPLQRGLTTHYKLLTEAERNRLKVVQQNVLKPLKTQTKFDIACVCNFSFYVLKDRSLLKRYFENVYKSLSKTGTFILEMAGGPGMIEDLIETSTGSVKPYGKFTYHWDQKYFDPITHDALYAIHFKLHKKYQGIQKLKDAFVYDWRLWTIPEVREVLAEVGFKSSVVYCETSYRGEGTGSYRRAEVAENDHAWISYVIGLK